MFDLTEYLAEKERTALEALHLRRPDYKDVQRTMDSTRSRNNESNHELDRTSSGRRASWAGWELNR